MTTFRGLQFSLSLMFLTMIFGCGNETPILGLASPEATACQPEVVQILVGDGFLKPTCGCAGEGELGKVYPAPGNLNCHLPTSNTQVFFYLWGAQIPHQIISTGDHKFVSSPVLDSKKTPQINSYSVSFKGSATYSFRDAYTGMVGNFIVP